MKTMRKAALTLAAMVLGASVVAISAPAHADTNWPCAACRTGGR